MISRLTVPSAKIEAFAQMMQQLVDNPIPQCDLLVAAVSVLKSCAWNGSLRALPAAIMLGQSLTYSHKDLINLGVPLYCCHVAGHAHPPDLCPLLHIKHHYSATTLTSINTSSPAFSSNACTQHTTRAN
jgi:hypothetical protein